MVVLLVAEVEEHYLAVGEHNPVKSDTRNVSSQTPGDTDQSKLWWGLCNCQVACV